MENSRRVIAIELLTAAHALAHRLDEDPQHTLGLGTQRGYQRIHDILFDMNPHTTVSDQIEAITARIQQGSFVISIQDSQ